MKLSQMTTDNAADALVKISANLNNILDDKEVMDALKEVSKAGVSDKMNGWSLLLAKLVPLCLKVHRKDLYGIVAVLDGKTEAQVGKLKLIETLAIIKNSVDKELLDFFSSIGRSAETTEAK